MVITSLRQSALSAIIADCPLKAMWDYGLGVPVSDRPTPVALALGNFFHLTYRDGYTFQIEEHELLPLNDLVDAFVTYWRLRTVEEGEQPITAIDWGERTEQQHRSDGIAMVQAYYRVYCKTEPASSEQRLSTTLNGVELTTRLDLVTKRGWIVDLKTSAVGVRRDGSEYFFRYSVATVQRLPQPYIHLTIHGRAAPYVYHVVGKGRQPLVMELPVVHRQQQVDNWQKRVLEPTLVQIQAGIFPARPGGLCNSCSYAKDSVRCGMLL